MKTLRVMAAAMCFTLGLYSSEYISSLKQDCYFNDDISCVKLGAIYEFEKKDFKKALAYFQKACELKNPIACFTAANLYNSEKLGKKDTKKALKLYEESCFLGFDGGCNMAQKLKKESL